MERRQSFDQVADLYGAARPGYPAALFDDLVSLAGLTAASRVLEVGCGAGQATGDLAARTGSVTAIDSGARLIDQARARVGAANIAFVATAFEAYPAGPGSFDLVASAQAWHWIPADVAYPKAAEALATDGSLALFGHVPLTPSEPLSAAFKAIYDAHAPGVWGRPSPQAYYRPTGPLPGLFAASGLFAPVAHRAYAWTWNLDAQTYAAYLRTDSGYHFLSEDRRFALFDDLARAVEVGGGAMAWPWESHLYVARRA